MLKNQSVQQDGTADEQFAKVIQDAEEKEEKERKLQK